MGVQTRPSPFSNADRRYAVIAGGDKEVVQGRDAAVRRAKELSKSNGRARVEGKDTRMEMLFSKGHLAKFRYDSRR